MLVVFGIYIAWRDYKGEIDSALSVVKDVLKQKHKKNIENINKDEKGIINTEVKKGAANRTFDDNIKKIEDIQDVNKKTYDKIEFIVICIGTIVWGYGGLLNKLYC